MRIVRDGRGDCGLDATALAETLPFPPKDLRRRVRLGLVTSFVEAGEGADAGLRRLTMEGAGTVELAPQPDQCVRFPVRSPRASPPELDLLSVSLASVDRIGRSGCTGCL